jgi:phosphoribosyl 1,2-cyclic phosphodiesterase
MADGRFAKDKTWCFYALNYAERRRNMTQGQWLVNNLLHTEEIPCINSLKEKLKNNDTKFIEKLQYFAQCVPGSDSYWRNKRAELISWIGRHVEHGNGAPSLFVNFYCAEYHWQDIEKLLNSRKKDRVRFTHLSQDCNRKGEGGK